MFFLQDSERLAPQAGLRQIALPAGDGEDQARSKPGLSSLFCDGDNRKSSSNRNTCRITLEWVPEHRFHLQMYPSTYRAAVEQAVASTSGGAGWQAGQYAEQMRQQQLLMQQMAAAQQQQVNLKDWRTTTTERSSAMFDISLQHRDARSSDI